MAVALPGATLPAVVEELLSEMAAAVQENARIPDEHLLSLKFIFGSSAVQALDLVDRQSVTLISSPSGRSVYQVLGSSGKTYTCLASCHYCSCPAFAFSVLRKSDSLLGRAQGREQTAAWRAGRTGLRRTDLNQLVCEKHRATRQVRECSASPSRAFWRLEEGSGAEEESEGPVLVLTVGYKPCASPKTTGEVKLPSSPWISRRNTSCPPQLHSLGMSL
ncbi:zinc finger SWIM domain-containing protein 7 isoform X1 [Meles meles]|uniref:zinc finger SWIM domain-containing protein 7 isoform X1 n=1 Tax=Meles meles TaxID=9662 RepID=UPI001E699768|nr:zinc finger SWIM domain-containing protein 7 isoform X1 [Meles meles]